MEMEDFSAARADPVPGLIYRIYLFENKEVTQTSRINQSLAIG
jgi:hypothetical protein